MSEPNASGLFTFFSTSLEILTTPEPTEKLATSLRPAPEMLEQALEPLTKLKIAPHPLLADDNAWVFKTTPVGGAVACRRWVLSDAARVVLDVFSLDDIIGRSYVKFPPAWYGVGWERGILVRGNEELKSCLDPLRVQLLKDSTEQYRLTELERRWKSPCLVRLADALAKVGDAEWREFQRRGRESLAIGAARAAYRAARTAVGPKAADECWDAYDQKPFGNSLEPTRR